MWSDIWGTRLSTRFSNVMEWVHLHMNVLSVHVTSTSCVAPWYKSLMGDIESRNPWMQTCMYSDSKTTAYNGGVGWYMLASNFVNCLLELSQKVLTHSHFSNTWNNFSNSTCYANMACTLTTKKSSQREISQVSRGTGCSKLWPWALHLWCHT